MFPVTDEERGGREGEVIREDRQKEEDKGKMRESKRKRRDW